MKMKRVSNVTVRKRIVALFLISLVVFITIIVRLGYVQFFMGDELLEEANELWTRDIVFEPERGNILDLNGDILAENVTAPSIVVVPRQIEHPEETAEKLANVLNITTDEVYEQITKNASSVNIRPAGIK